MRLKKPILVLKKVEVEEGGGGDADSKRVELDVIGVIRHKILFKTRPKALISSKRLLNILSYIFRFSFLLYIAILADFRL